MRLYVHMMLCGSICTLLYLFFNSILPYELPLEWRRRLLRINIVFYLLPVPWIAAEVRELVKWILEKTGMLFPSNGSPDIFDATSIWKSFIVRNEDGKMICITGYQKLLPVILVVLAGCFTLLLGWVALYVRTSSRYRRTMLFLDTDSYLKDTDVRHKMGKITVGISPCVSSPVTVGLVRPAILLPVDYHEYEDSMEEVLLHEWNHVSCMDIVERFCCFAVVVVHFFNPLAYYLLQEGVTVSEMLSDEAAVRGRTRKQKADYIRCIMEASQRPCDSKVTALSLGVSKSLLRKRMEKIMETSRKKIWKKRVAAVMVAGCAFASCIPALAYQKPREYVQTGRDGWNDKDILIFTQTGEENPMEENQMDYSHGDTVFVSEDGIADYKISQGQQEQKRSICAHSYTSGTVSEHEKHADGSCTVVSYQADKCTKCGNVITGDEISTVTYKTCQHFASDDAQPVQNLIDETCQPETETGIVNVDTLRMRSSASADAAVVSLLEKGKEIRIGEEVDGFYQIWCTTSDGECITGYVRKEYVDLLTEGNDFYQIWLAGSDGEYITGYVGKEYADQLTEDILKSASK